MPLTYKENYWDSPPHKAEFIRFLKQIHNLDLSLWDRMGYWDDNYRPFSYFDGDRLVAHACLYSMDMTVLGKRCRVAQVSAVGTDPEYRRRGLGMEINQRAINWARENHDFYFLFADDEAIPLYEKCGFRGVDEHKALMKTTDQPSKPGAVKLDMSRQEHRDLVYRLASNRAPVSDLLGVMNEKLLMFWFLYFLDQYLYYIKKLDLLVVCRHEGGVATIFDVVGATVPAFAEFYPFVCVPDDSSVEFLFMIDKMHLTDYDLVKIENNGTHVMGNFPLAGTEFMIPFTAHA